MNLNNLDAELNAKVIESIKESLKDKNIKITFETPNDLLLECSIVKDDINTFRIVKRLVIEEIDDLNPKYKWFIRKRIIKHTKGMNQQQSINWIKQHTKYLFFLRPFLGKKIKKNELRSIVYKINYNNIIIDIKKDGYDRLNYYTKYVYKLQQLHKLNHILKIDQEFNVVFDDDQAASNMYNSMYNEFKDIIKPPNKD